MRRPAMPTRPVVQVRHGGRVDPETALPQVAAPESELADELLLIEMRLLSALRHREAASSPKAKIVAALRKKG